MHLSYLLPYHFVCILCGWGRGGRRKLKNEKFTIISNNCWAGHVYRYFNLPYDTPTVGLFFYTDEYIKFLKNLKKYLSCDLQFISLEQSKYKDDLLKKNINCPIGMLDDVEICFLHYQTPQEAKEKWNRRCQRIHWDNLFVKMSEQNLCTIQALKEFDSLNFLHKAVFVTKNYGLKSQIIYKNHFNQKEIPNDTWNFRTYLNPIDWLNQE